MVCLFDLVGTWICHLCCECFDLGVSVVVLELSVLWLALGFVGIARWFWVAGRLCFVGVLIDCL